MTTCSPMCVPDETCATVDCGVGYTCTETCQATTCQTQCVPSGNDPGECYGTVTCTSAAPACPVATTPGVLNGCYTGYCIPLGACGPSSPGTCYGTVTCDTLPPVCPSGTLPGISATGCYSGYCIPTNACEIQACETLAMAACTSRSDCIPVYDGTSCTCYPDHCDCQVLTYDHCYSGLL